MAEFIKLHIDDLPELNGVTVSGTVEVAPGSCAFFVI